MFKREKTGKTFYIIITIFIITVILFTVLFSTNSLFNAYVDDRFLVNGWFESGERSYNEQLFGLEKQFTFKYIINNSSEEKFNTFLTVTSIKTIFMINEQELLDKTIQTISNAAMIRNININDSSQFTSSRFLKNGHNTYFIVLNGTKIIDGFVEKIKIIGETWNCAYSGSSIICIGVAQTTDVKNGNYYENFTHWAKIIGDEKGIFNEIYNSNNFIDSNGLIFNVKCH
jgi:hypothetical protein